MGDTSLRGRRRDASRFSSASDITIGRDGGGDAALIPNAIEELPRYDPPSQLRGRTTTCDVALHGVTVPAGSKTMLATGGAKRDERAFDRRLQMRIAFEALFVRYPDGQVDLAAARRAAISNPHRVADLQMRSAAHA